VSWWQQWRQRRWRRIEARSHMSGSCHHSSAQVMADG
jgi:hypothetical protein